MSLTGEPGARAIIGIGAIGAAVGVALSGSMAPTLGGVFLIGGWLALVVGIHRFGRGGTDA